MKTKLASFVAGGALVFGGAALSFADTYTFPPGGGDLADLSAWQVGYPALADLPGVDDSIRLGSSSRFILSKDLTVKEFTFNKKDAELDFAASGNHTLKVLGEAHAFCAHNGTVRGGVIDRNGQNMLWFQDDGLETTVTGGGCHHELQSVLRERMGAIEREAPFDWRLPAIRQVACDQQQQRRLQSPKRQYVV